MKNLLAYLLLGCILLFASCAKDGTSVLEHTVTIGEQLWDNKNLDVSTYRNGDPIPQVTDPTQWANLTTGAWCYYNNDPANNTIYGKLYNWYAVNDSLHGGLAPEGWHIPSSTDWSYLADFLGGDSLAGGKMKATDTSLWLSPNLGATNSSRFNALPAGIRSFYMSNFYSIKVTGTWWTSTPRKDSGYANYAWAQSVNAVDPNLNKFATQKQSGYSVRCLQGNGSSYLKIGDHYLGGIIAYKFKAGDLGYDPNMAHGIIVAEQFIKNGAGSIWIDWKPPLAPFPNMDQLVDYIGYGPANTKALVTAIGDGEYAAKLCDDLDLNGYSDWCLPSLFEICRIFFASEDVGIPSMGTLTSDPHFCISSIGRQSFRHNITLSFPIVVLLRSRGHADFGDSQVRQGIIRPIRYF